MKTKRKLLALILALQLIISSVTPVNAEDNSGESEAVTRGGITVTGGTEGVDWEYKSISITAKGYKPSSTTTNEATLVGGGTKKFTYNAIVVKTGTPVTMSSSASTATCIYVEADVHADITLAGITISGIAPINVVTGTDTSLYLTVADGTVNTLTTNSNSYFPAIRCGEGSSLTIDDGVRNVDTNGNAVDVSYGKVSRTAVLSNGTTVQEGERATALDSVNPGTLNANIANSGKNNAAAIGGCCLESSGKLTFNGGIINATARGYGKTDNSTYGAAGIGGGQGGGGTTMIFNGGYITATASYHGAGIGGAWRFSGSGTGTVSYTLPDQKINNSKYKIGNKSYWSYECTRAGDIYINGGYILARGAYHGNAFGQGCCGNNYAKEIVITGGTLIPSIYSGGSGLDIGGDGCDVVVLGGSVRLAGPGRFQSNAGNGYAYGSLDRDPDKLVFMTKIDLSGYTWAGYSDLALRDMIDTMSVYIGGQHYEYGLPAGLDSSGALYLWLPQNANGKEVRVEASVLQDGNADNIVSMEPFYIDKVDGNSYGTPLKRFVIFDIPEGIFTVTSKIYDGVSVQAPDIQNAGLTSRESDGSLPLNDPNTMTYASQRLDENGNLLNEAEISGLPVDVGVWQITATSLQYANTAGFKESYYGHRGYYKPITITRAESSTSVSYEQIEDDKLADKIIQLKAVVCPAEGEATTCASPTGKVQFYVDGVPLGSPIELEPSDTTNANGYHYSTAVYNWKPDAEDIVDFAESHEITVKYIGDVEGVNYKSSEGAAGSRLEITPIEQETPLKIYDVTDSENPEDITGEEITKNFAEGGFSIKGEGGNSSKELVYESSDPSIAEIDENGEITYKDYGTVTITVKRPGNVAFEEVTEEVTIVIQPSAPAEENLKITKNAENVTDPNQKAQVGDVISYVISVENTQVGSLWKDVSIRDVIPNGLQLDENSLYLTTPDGTEGKLAGIYYDSYSRQLLVPVGDVRGGEKYSLRFEAKVTAEAIANEGETPIDIGNIAVAEGETPSGDEVDSTIDNPVYPTEEDKPENGGVIWGDPVPEIEKTAENVTNPEGSTQVGDIVAYTIKIENKLAGSLWKNVVIKDYIPEGMDLIEESISLTSPDGTEEKIGSGYYDEASRLLRVPIGAVYGGEKYSLRFEVTIRPAAVGKDIANEAEAEGENPKGEEIGDTTDEPVYPSEEDKPENGGVIWGDPSPSLEKTAKNNTHSNGVVAVEDRVTYTIKVENMKEGSLWKDVAIRDRLPEGLQLDTESMYLINPNGEEIHVDASAYRKEDRMISVYVGDVYGGEKYVFSFDVVITTEAIGKDIGNEAVAIGGKPSDSTGNADEDGGSGSDDNGEWGPSGPGGWDGGYTTGDYEPGSPYFPENDPFNNLDAGTGDGTDEKVYPWDPDNNDDGLGEDVEDKVLPSNPEPELEKKVENITHPEGDTEENDVLTYEIELTNPKIGSLWRNVLIFDYLPDELVLDTSSLRLQHPNGKITKVSAKVYDKKTHMIKVPIAELWGGETYILRYKVSVVLNDDSVEKEEIVNIAEATGDNPDGTPTSAGKKPSSSASVKYPKTDEPVEDKPVEDKPVEDKPVEDKPVEDKPVEDEPVVDKPVVDKPVEEESVVDKPAEEDQNVEKPDADKSEESNTEVTPGTGDHNNLVGYMILFGVSVFAIIVVLMARKRKNK